MLQQSILTFFFFQKKSSKGTKGSVTVTITTIQLVHKDEACVINKLRNILSPQAYKFGRAKPVGLD